MRVYQSNEIKNFVLLGNSGSGKTTLAEAMMFEGGVIQRRGEVEKKNTVSDYHAIEQEQVCSVYSTVLYTEYMDKKLNIIDAPGSDNFIGGAVTALNVTDTAIMVVNAQHAVETGTEIQWRYAEAAKRPAMFVVNQLDHDNANFEQTVEELQHHFGKHAVVVQYPTDTGRNFHTVIDVLLMKMYQWEPEGGEPKVSEIPNSEKEKAEALHNTLVETAAENDEELMELFFEKGTLDEDELRKGIKYGMVHRDLFPIFCVSAKRDMGIRRLMQFLINVAPFVDETITPKTQSGVEVKPDVAGAPCIFVFKSTIEEHIGEVMYFKVMSGEISEGQDFYNLNKQTKERISQLFVVAGKIRNKITTLKAGDIGATVKLKVTKTNHTLVADKDLQWQFAPIAMPNSKHRVAIRAISESEEEKLSEALSHLHEEDPTLVVEYSKELKQTILHGQGEHHLNTIRWSIEHIHKVACEFLTPKIPYRETITKTALAQYRHKKQSGGAGQFGEVHLAIEPYIEGLPDPTELKADGQTIKLNVKNKEEHLMEWGGKLILYNCIVGGAIDTRFIPAILKGILEKMENGPLTGSYARDIRVTVYDGKMHPVDSNEISFKIAGAKAFSEAFRNAGPKIMEPVYDVEVLTPPEYMGDIMSDMQNRRAMIQGMSSEGGYDKLLTRVPLAEMNRYSTTLRALTHGKATYSMEFVEYQQVPHDVQENLLKTYVLEEVEA
jgi:elongation factor G